MKGRPEPGDYVRLNEERNVTSTTARYRYAVLGEKEQGGWSAALVEAGDRNGRGSCVSVWLAPRSFRVA